METLEVPPQGAPAVAHAVSPPPVAQPVDAAPGSPPVATRHLQKAWRALERAGFRIFGAGDAPPADAPGVASALAAVEGYAPGPQVAPAVAFDEAATRVGVQGVVETADSLAAHFVAKSAAGIVGERDAAKFGERVKMTEPVRTGIINAGVEVCRAENVTLPPSATLTILVGGWLVGVYSVVKDIQSLKNSGGAAAPPTAVPEKAA